MAKTAKARFIPHLTLVPRANFTRRDPHVDETNLRNVIQTQHLFAGTGESVAQSTVGSREVSSFLFGKVSRSRRGSLLPIILRVRLAFSSQYL
jgi:hypothetical protein